MEIVQIPMTEFVSDAAPAQVVEAPAPPHPFGAGKAILLIVLVLVAQMIVGFFAAALNMVRAVMSGTRIDDAAALARAAGHLGGIAIIMALVATGGVVLLLGVSWAREEIRDRTDDGIGVRAASLRATILAALAGAAIGGGYLLVMRSAAPPHPGTRPGPLAQLALSGGFDRVTWIVVALVLAPPIEEFLFRGLLLKGFSRDWGRIAGATVVTLLFVLSHAPEVGLYWPAALAIFTLALSTLAVRITTGSLAPPMFLHAFYNLAIVTYVVVAA